MRSQRLTVATNFLPYQAVRCCAFSLVGNAHLVGAKTALLRPAWKRVTSARLSCSSSPKKVTLRLCCSLINALATRRLATNFFRYRAVRLISFLQTAVAANFFYQAIRCCAFPFVWNAHLVVTDCVSLAAAFLAAMLTPSFLLSEKSHAASLLLACKRARDAPTCYQLFSVSRG